MRTGADSVHPVGLIAGGQTYEMLHVVLVDSIDFAT